MLRYTFVITPWVLNKYRQLTDPLNQTLELSVTGTSFKNSLQRLLRTPEFDDYLHANTTAYVYWKSCFNGKLYSIPLYDDIEEQ